MQNFLKSIHGPWGKQTRFLECKQMFKAERRRFSGENHLFFMRLITTLTFNVVTQCSAVIVKRLCFRSIWERE